MSAPTAYNLPEINRNTVESLVVALQRDPGSYRAFGPYWWNLKRTLVGLGYTNATVPGLADGFDDPECRERVEATYPHPYGRLNATLHHYVEQLRSGNRYGGHSTMPDDESVYVLHDPDMGAANLIGV